MLGLHIVQGQIAVRIPDKDVTVRSIEHFGDETWFLTSGGAYRIKGDSEPQTILDNGLDVLGIYHFDNEIWLVAQKSGFDENRKPQTVYRVEGNSVAAKFSGDRVRVTHFGDETWLNTSRGAYRIKADSKPQRIPAKEFHVESVSHFGDETWLEGWDRDAASVGASLLVYRIKGDSEPTKVLEKYFSIGPAPSERRIVYNFDNETWLATPRGAYRIKGDSEPQTILEDLDVVSIQQFGDEIWLKAKKPEFESRDIDEGAKPLRAYRIKGNSAPEQITTGYVNVNSIEHFEDETWLATTAGAYRIKGDSKPNRIPDKYLNVYSINHFGDETWLETDDGAYRIKGSAWKRIPDKNLRVDSINHFGNETWLATNDGAYRIKGDECKRIPDKDVRANSITQFAGETWVAASDGAYRIKAETYKRFPDKQVSVKSTTHFAEETWLITSEKDGAYRIKNNECKRIPDEDLYVESVSHFGDETWLLAGSAYRIDDDITMVISAATADSWWKRCLESILPGNVWIAGPIIPTASYKRLSDNHGRYPKDLKGAFEFIMEPTQEKFESRRTQFFDAEHATLNLTGGWQTLFVAARDQWGNTSTSVLRGLVLPGLEVIPLLLAAFWLAVLCIVLALAPFNTFCHTLLMNPFVRKYGSFGFVPIVLTVFPPARRHLLRRYFAGIRRDENFTRLQQTYVVPTADFLPERFGERLKNQSPFLLLGRSGIGKTAFFHYLTSYYASRPRRAIEPRGAVPVFVQLSLYEGVDPEDMFDAQLKSYGLLTDPDLNHWFLQQGGFLFFLDGLNEISHETRQSVNRFVHEYKKRSYFGLSSQQDHQELVKMEVIQLASLSPEKIEELLKQELGGLRALDVIKQLTPATCELYAIPQDLQLAIKLIKDNKTLPQSREELYEMTLTPIFQDWINAGKGDFPDILTTRAYKMLCTSGSFF